MSKDFSLELLAGADGFGDGEHPSTHLALQALHALADVLEPQRILDIGCGSGVLAMTAAHLWPNAQIWAADIEASAVEVAKRNIAHNQLAERITTLRSDGYRDKVIQAAAPFDLVLCNMTADIIVPLAAGLKQVLAEEGVAVLSGILRWRSQEVLAMHAHLGMQPVANPLTLDGWDTHILVKRTGL